MTASNRKKKVRATLVTGGGNAAHHQAVHELRRSGAAGKHKNKADKGRAENRRRAIRENV